MTNDGLDYTAPKRPLPELSPATAPFWTGGKSGSLCLPQCEQCSTILHPSLTVCPDCLVSELKWTAVSGRATVVAATVGSHWFLPGFTPPYSIAIVALEDAPGVRLTTNITGISADSVVIGLPVRVQFEQQGDVWFPLFEPDHDREFVGTSAGIVAAPTVEAPAMVNASKFEDRVAITGIGMSTVGRRLMRPAVSLTVEACRAAVADAGLTMDDIDGLCTYPGALLAGGGITEGGVPAVEEVLRIKPTWHNGGMETSGQTGSIVAAMLAVASGLCRHVLCFRTVWESTHTELLRTGRLPLPASAALGGDFQWRIPFGAASAAHWIAMHASQYMAKYGVGREGLGAIAVNARTNAALNPAAIYQEPITMDDYLSARMISTPFGLYDCDVPCDGSVAVVISAKESAYDLRHDPVLVEAVGTKVAERQSWDQGTITHLPNIFGPAAHLWSRTDLRHSDVDVAEIYDGFSFNALSWLEALGFCDVGEGTEFVGDGRRISLTGELPMNTHGGQLSAGRLHGYGFIYEAVQQLRGDADARQIDDARVAIVSVGGGVPAGAFLLRRD